MPDGRAPSALHVQGVLVTLGQARKVLERRVEHLARQMNLPDRRESSKQFDRAERGALLRVFEELDGRKQKP